MVIALGPGEPVEARLDWAADFPGGRVGESEGYHFGDRVVLCLVFAGQHRQWPMPFVIESVPGCR